MLSKIEIDALLQSPNTSIRKANERDLIFINNYINNRFNLVEKNLRCIFEQPEMYDVNVIEETIAQISFSITTKKCVESYELTDS